MASETASELDMNTSVEMPQLDKEDISEEIVEKRNKMILTSVVMKMKMKR